MWRELFLRNHAAPDPATEVVNRLQRFGLEQDLSLVDDCHSHARLAHVLDDVHREKDDAILTELAQEVEKANALGRVEPCGRLVDDEQLRITQERHGKAEALPHATRVATELLLPYVPQVRLPEERLDDLLARGARQCP